MARYIDAEKLIENIVDKQVLAIYEYWDFDTLKDIRKTIDETKTADVQEVRHGEWMKKYYSGMSVSKGFVSSCCDMWNERDSNFCPNCGTKMDL